MATGAVPEAMWDWLDVLLHLDWYLEHWRGILGAVALVGGLVLAFGPLAILVPGLILAAVGLLFVIWEIMSWFERD